MLASKNLPQVDLDGYKTFYLCNVLLDNQDMPYDDQAVLVDIPQQPEVVRRAVTAEPRLRTANRDQTLLIQVLVDELISPDHKARAIWELTGRLDLSGFNEPLKVRKGGAGRAAWDPRLMVSIWVYAYSEGISSAREIERLMEWEPGLQWLGGLATVNHHTLSDFRVERREELNELFAQILGMLEASGLLSLDRVMHDGTKIRAQAGIDTFRREKSLREHLERARKVVESMGDPQAEAPAKSGKEAAKERAARERCNRLEEALKEWDELAAEATEKEKEKLRVSKTEPEARQMKHGDNAITPSYNAQISTEAKNKIIVGAHLSQCSSDANSLMPAIEQVKQNLDREPAQMVVDGGFTNRGNIVACAEKKIDLVGSMADPVERSEASMKAAGIDPAFAPHHFKILEKGKRLECPGGCELTYLRQSRKRGDLYHQYQSKGEDCLACHYQSQCCPKEPEQGRTVSIRIEEHRDVAAFRKKMEQEETKAIYRQRGPVAEFPNAWIKEKLRVRKFRVRGLVKAGTELIWACLTYNVMQWLRLTKPEVA
jgi:transposase